MSERAVSPLECLAQVFPLTTDEIVAQINAVLRPPWGKGETARIVDIAASKEDCLDAINQFINKEGKDGWVYQCLEVKEVEKTSRYSFGMPIHLIT